MSNSSNSSPTAPLIAGFAGGVISTSLLLPLDVIKLRMQVSETTSRKHSGHKRPLGSWRVLFAIIKHEGVAGLYQGWTPAVLGSALSWGGYFYFYEGFKRRLVEYKVGSQPGVGAVSRESVSKVLNHVDNFVLACAAGGVMVIVTNPVWLVKTRMQLQMRKASKEHHVRLYNGTWDAFRTIVKEEGILSLYKGSGPAMLLTSHGGVQFVVYEFLKKHFNYSRARREENNQRVALRERFKRSLGFLTMGAVAKIVATTVTYPLQVIKSRLQQQSESVELTEDGNVRYVRRRYRGMMDVYKRILQREGIGGFFKGCIPNAIRVAPGAATTFVVYEAVMDWLDQ